MRNAGLDEAYTRIKIAGRNINNLRYADDTTLMAESEKLEKVKEENEKSYVLWYSTFKWVYLSFTPLLLLLFFSQLFVRPPQTTIFPSYISFSWVGS